MVRARDGTQPRVSAGKRPRGDPVAKPCSVTAAVRGTVFVLAGANVPRVLLILHLLR